MLLVMCVLDGCLLFQQIDQRFCILFVFGDIVSSHSVSRLQAGQSRVRMLVGAGDTTFLHNIQTSSGAYPASYSVGTGVLSWV